MSELSLAVDLYYPRPKYKIAPSTEFGILTAGDSNYFPGVQLLYATMRSTNNLSMTLVDLGLTEQQIKWCERQKHINLLRIPDNELIVSDITVKMWQSWNKPLYITYSPYKYVLWIDSDCIVLRNLSAIFQLLQQQPVFVENPMMCIVSPPALYDILPLPAGILNRDAEISVTAGFLGLCLNRKLDNDFLNEWIDCTKLAYDNLDKWQDATNSWYDETSMRVAIQRRNMLDSTVFHKDIHSYPPTAEHYPTTLELVKRSNEEFRSRFSILHLTNKSKPWLKEKISGRILNIEVD